jgi:phosphoserine phosphatase RsbU/P
MFTESVVVDVSHDWVAACGLPERFMEIPHAKTPRLTWHARCRQIRALGGDCFHFVPLPGRRVGLAVADASGKGLPAALIVANVQSSLRTAALFAPEDPAAVVSAVNSQLHACSPVELFAENVYQAQAVQLYPGDLIAAYTDAFVEATNTASEEWDVKGLLAAVKHCRTRQPESVVKAAFAALDEFSGDNQTDDATILAALVY